MQHTPYYPQHSVRSVSEPLPSNPQMSPQAVQSRGATVQPPERPESGVQAPSSYALTPDVDVRMDPPPEMSSQTAATRNMGPEIREVGPQHSAWVRRGPSLHTIEEEVEMSFEKGSKGKVSTVPQFVPVFSSQVRVMYAGKGDQYAHRYTY